MEEAAGSREERAGRSEEEASREKVARTTQGLASRGSMQPRQVHGADRCGTQRHARVARGQGGAHCPGTMRRHCSSCGNFASSSADIVSRSPGLAQVCFSSSLGGLMRS